MSCGMNEGLGQATNEWTSSTGSLEELGQSHLGSWAGLGLGPTSLSFFSLLQPGRQGAIAHQSEHVVFAGCGAAAYVCGDGNRWVGWSWESRDAHTAVPGHCLALSGLEKTQLLEASATVPRT